MVTGCAGDGVTSMSRLRQPAQAGPQRRRDRPETQELAGGTAQQAVLHDVDGVLVVDHLDRQRQPGAPAELGGHVDAALDAEQRSSDGRVALEQALGKCSLGVRAERAGDRGQQVVGVGPQRVGLVPLDTVDRLAQQGEQPVDADLGVDADLEAVDDEDADVVAWRAASTCPFAGRRASRSTTSDRARAATCSGCQLDAAARAPTRGA